MSNEEKVEELNSDQLSGSIKGGDLLQVLQITEIPIVIGIDGKNYKVKNNFYEEDLSIDLVNKLHKLYLMLIFGVSKTFNMDVAFYVKENDLFSILEEQVPVESN